MNIDDMEQDLLADYRHLAHGLRDMIEGERLTEADIPDDMQWLRVNLEKLAKDQARLNAALEREGS